MVVGSGLLATTFSHYATNNNVIIFASGVSNSTTKDPIAFKRELDLLDHYLDADKTFIYFSTISVHDPDLSETPYIQHKLHIEHLIAERCSSYIIFRLPILLGRSNNPHTLCNFIHNQIINQKTITVYKKACRYIIDVDDLKTHLSAMIDSGKYTNSTIDINYNNAISIPELIHIYEQTLGIKATTQEIEKGGCYKTSNAPFLDYLEQNGITIPSEYLAQRICKYYPSGQLDH